MYLSFIQFIKQLPFLRLIIPLIIGIFIQINYRVESTFFLYIIILMLVILLFSEYIKGDKKKFEYRFLSGLSVNIIFIILGAWIVQVNTAEPFKHTDEELFIEAILSETPVEKTNSFKTYALITKYYTSDSIYSTNKKIVLYFEKDNLANSLSYGDKILFKSRINEVKTSGNPYEFNYKQFLFRKGIVGQTYIRTKHWTKTGTEQGSFLFSLAYSARNTLADIYKANNIKDQEFAVLQALTLGDKSEIEEDTKQSYVASGAMHILAVSGLHVGIIYMLLNFFFRFLDKLKSKRFEYGKVLKAILILALLWSFALVSGMSPSVSRAATMFSFVIIGRAMKSKVNIYNSLAASAFILLLLKPYLITEVGFQLSYSAVFAIVFFQPKIVSIFIIKNKIIYYIWSLTAVSIAAQIGTAPISLFYFHIFPWYFMLTNIIVIPAAIIIIHTAAALLMTSFVPFVSTGIAFILKKIIWLLNFLIFNIEHLPYSFSENISFNISDLVFSSLLVILIGIFLAYKQAGSIQKAFLIIFIWLSFSTYQKITIDSKNLHFVYNINKKSAINIIGKENHLIIDTANFNKTTIKYGPLSNWLHLNKTNYNIINISDSIYSSNSLFKLNNYISVQSKKILIINNKKQVKFKANKKLAFDYIIISKSPKIRIKNIVQLYNPGVIIFDSSNSFYSIEGWKKECDVLNLACYSVIEKGAFSAEL